MPTKKKGTAFTRMLEDEANGNVWVGKKPKKVRRAEKNRRKKQRRKQQRKELLDGLVPIWPKPHSVSRARRLQKDTLGVGWDYEVYLKSLHWKELRKAALILANHSCVQCKGTLGCLVLHVHHLRYKDEKGSILYRELPSDVVVLCELCHNDTHDR